MRLALLALLVQRPAACAESERRAASAARSCTTSAYVSIRQHTSAALHQHTSAYVSIHQEGGQCSEELPQRAAASAQRQYLYFCASEASKVSKVSAPGRVAAQIS